MMHRLALSNVHTFRRHFTQNSAALLLVALTAPPLVASCKNSQPVRFGASLRSLHSDLPSVDSEKEDCPICKKYSQGPCGDLFTQWLACTDQHRESENSHIDKCASFAEPLAECLQLHKVLYDNINVYKDEPIRMGLQDEWVNVVKEVEASNKSQAFPLHLKPTLEYRPHIGTGIAGFVMKYDVAQPIIMACIQDSSSGDLLAAGSTADLFEYEGRGVLKLVIPASTTAVTVSALYDGGEENHDLWLSHQFSVPT